jgi:hypothetical protein
VESANGNNGSLLKPTIRLFKYWNATNGYVVDSFMFEKWIISQSFWFDTNQKDYLFSTFDKVELSWESAQWRKDKLARAKQIIATVRDYEKKEMPVAAEGEVQKLIPLG